MKIKTTSDYMEFSAMCDAAISKYGKATLVECLSGRTVATWRKKLQIVWQFE